MTAARMYLSLFAAAVAAGCGLALLDVGPSGFASTRRVGATAGGVTFLFLAAALVPTVMLLPTKGRGSAGSGTAVGLLVLSVLSAFIYNGSKVERTLSSFPFDVPGCTFSAVFPEQPELRELVVAGGLTVVQANVYGQDTVLRAECVPTEGWLVPTREAVLAELRSHADRSGLMDLEFEVVQTRGFVHGIARGGKTVSGIAATYEVHLLVDDVSMMGLIAGGPSSGYPQPGIHDFLASGRPRAMGAL